MEAPKVLIRQGWLRGIVEKNIDGSQYIAFKGIPYAKPPVGQLRFRDSEPAEPWTGTREASEFGSVCAQSDFLLSREVVGDDDCLYLNIYTEHIDIKALRPVMVWVHGGGFYCGSGNNDMYGPDFLVKKEIVLVTFNYRVGVLGFLDLEDEVAAGNQGLKDQVMALRWIQENISSFGGDSTNVTIFGESAGGASIHYLTLSPLAQGLFHKAISQSGVASNPWASLLDDPKKFAYRLMSYLGKETTDPKVIVEYLRTVDCQKLVEAEHNLLTTEEKCQMMHPFRPVIDSKSPKPFLSQPLSVAVRSGVKVPFLIGYNSHEGMICLPVSIKNFPKIEANFEVALHPHVLSSLKGIPDAVNRLKRFYFKDEPISDKNIQKYVEMCGDIYFVNGIQDVVQIQADKSVFPTYFYKFSYDSETSFIKKILNVNLPGTSHGDDLFYLFCPSFYKNGGSEPPQPNSTEYKLNQRFVQMWTDFAKTGNPTPNTSELIPVTWQPIQKGTAIRNLSITDDIKMETNPDLEKYSAWNNLKNKL